jgi:A/G-specific adenine glycosylase
MDYGTYLKKQGAGRIAKSSHYKKQSVLKGSIREIRGQIIKALAIDAMPESTLRQKVVVDERFESALASLEKDGLVSRTGANLHLTK